MSPNHRLYLRWDPGEGHWLGWEAGRPDNLLHAPFLSYLDPVTAGPWGVLVCRADTSTHITVLDWSWWKGKKENGQTELYPAKKQKSMPAAHQPGNPSSSVWENHLTFPGLNILSSKRSGLGWGWGGGGHGRDPI